MPSLLVRVQKELRTLSLTSIFRQFGRDKELEIIRSAIRRVSADYSHFTASARGAIALTPSGSVVSGSLESRDPNSDRDSKSTLLSETPASDNMEDVRQHLSSNEDSSSPSHSSTSNPMAFVSDGIRRIALHSRRRGPRTHGLVIVGPPGYTFCLIMLVHIVNSFIVLGKALWCLRTRQDGEVGIAAYILSQFLTLCQLMDYGASLNSSRTALHRFKR